MNKYAAQKATGAGPTWETGSGASIQTIAAVMSLTRLKEAAFP